MAPSGERDARKIASEKLSAIRSYTRMHQTDKLFHVMLARLLETQPIDPIQFLLEMTEDDPEMDAVIVNARMHRFDLRRERTKKKLLMSFYNRLQLLQKRQFAELEEISFEFLQAQCDDPDTITLLGESFPKHTRMLMTHLRKKTSGLRLQDFVASGLSILQLPGTH
uniref:Uncharacterized protein AlNc14C39G3341 n=1 Tax=Albugo laibachii Nc14 TaxID=890382 RepID=F0W974_9STRA|nr:conserved hypothetical protein [Albugo laibachii Nc14]|eukprot:CCA17687.1 conserved hypothetical protein [Albugo laibachii Nc14]